MHFTAAEHANDRVIWALILENLGPTLQKEVSAASSSFYRTADGIECSVRRANGMLIAHYYSESDRMGNRRWSCEIV